MVEEIVENYKFLYLSSLILLGKLHDTETNS